MVFILRQLKDKSVQIPMYKEEVNTENERNNEDGWKSTMLKIKFLFIVLTLFCSLNIYSTELKKEIRIALVFTEDPLFYINTFAPTIDHLRKSLPQYKFITKEIQGTESREEIKRNGFSFLISPAGFFASFDPSSEGLRQIATRHSSQARSASESIGSTIITLASRKDISSLRDLGNKKIVTRDDSSLSGWLSAKDSLSEVINTKELERNLITTKYNYPDVFSYLLSGEADAAVIPSCELEKIPEASAFKVIGEMPSSLKCKVSTPLYPDFVFSSFPSATPDVVKAVSVSLLTMDKMPDDATWGIASDFRTVLQLFKKLEIGPYHRQPFSIRNFLTKYRTETLLAVALLIGVMFHIYRSNLLVFQRTRELRKAIEQRDQVAEIARNSLKRLNQMEKRGILSQLSNLFAHELKQPLSTVVNYANGLKMYGNQASLDPVVQEGIEAIASESAKAAKIVDRVREYAKSSGPLSSEKTTDITSAIQQAVDAFRLYVSTDCEVVIKLPTKALIQGDPFELEILVLNLLRNAADACESLKEKAKIEVSLEDVNQYWKLTIADNGPPIDDAMLVRMKNSLQSSLKIDGLGLGLMIVLAIVERHRAQIHFLKRKPQGLEIAITFKKIE